MSKKFVSTAALGLLSCVLSFGCCHNGACGGGSCASGTCGLKGGHPPSEYASSKKYAAEQVDYEEGDEEYAESRAAATAERPTSHSQCSGGSCRH